MTFLKDFSVLWSLLHTLLLFLLLFESRYPRKKTLILSLATMIPLILVNTVIFVLVGTERYMTYLLLTCSLPSLVFFWFLAKHRDGRFFFTFCMVDSILLEIIYITNILDFYLGNTYIFMFVVRITCIPLLELLIYKKLRPIYLSVQRSVKKGWYVFAAISALFYVAMTLSMSYPTLITSRPAYLPAFVLYLVLLPIIYIHIFSTLRNQQRLYEMTEQDNILRLQVSNMTARMEEFSAANEKFRTERHDFRHKMQAIVGLIEHGEYDKLRQVVLSYTEAIRETAVKRYSSSAVIDAVLSSYLQKAESKCIKVSVALSFPEPLPVDEAELATVFANAIENAIHACEKLDADKRRIDVKVLTSPRFMLQISNSYDGAVEFDENSIPVSHEEGHGFGTRSIVAFCNKNKAFYEFKADSEMFRLRISF